MKTQYDAYKAERGLVDFTDLETLLLTLLEDESLASRLSMDYDLVLVDEFQDTNPLQWSIVRAWLNAYGEDAGQPSVFKIGRAHV